MTIGQIFTDDSDIGSVMLAAKIFRHALNVDRSKRVGRVYHRVVRKLANWVVPKGALVPHSVDGISILFPFRHNTPHQWAVDPDNSKSLGRVAKAVADKYPASSMVDIGANIGDSAAIIRSAGVTNLLLAIEGVSSFFDVLNANSASLDIIAWNAFVGVKAETRHVRQTVYEGGNAVLGANDGGDSAPSTVFKPLPDIIAEARLARPVKLIKTDIEGFDIPVLDASAALIREDKPALFFELHVADQDEKAFGIGWRRFLLDRQADGYFRALFWLNSTDFLASARLDDGLGLDALDSYLRNRGGEVYADVCLVHDADMDILIELQKVEVANAASKRPS